MADENRLQGRQTLDIDQINAQVAVVNRLLNDMSQKAQRAFASMGHAPLAKPIEDLAKAATETNQQVSKMSSGINGAIQVVTRATTTYNKVGKEVTAVVEGLNNAGERVRQQTKDGELQAVQIEVKAKDPNAELVKKTKVAAAEMKKAISEYNTALKEGNVGAVEHGERVIANLKDQIRTLRIRTLEEGISEEAQREVVKIADDTARALERQVNQVRQREMVSANKNTEKFNADTVKAAEQELRNLVKAQKDYDAALRSGDAVDRENAQSRIASAKDQLAYLKEVAAEGLLQANAQEKVNAAVQEAIRLEESYQRARERKQSDSAEAEKRENEAQIIKDTEAAYRRLVQAQGEYVAAVKSENDGRLNYWQQEIDASTQALQAVRESAETSELTEATKQKIIQITNDASQAEAKHNDAVEATKKNMDAQAKAAKQADENIRNAAAQAERWLATMLIMRGLTSVWREMTDYAASYYDAMNEIRIITGDSIEEAERMGAVYRSMAQDMSVSSTEIAKAAVEFWRQGLPEEEVNKRLQYTTAYAKISALEFDTAAELMTAAANGMGVSAERIADVWSYLGDASASG